MFARENKVVELGNRAPHERDLVFIAPHMSNKEHREHEFTDEELKKFRKNSVFEAGPLLPFMRKPWAGHMLISGATGAGKTWVAKEILKDDDRPVYFVSDIYGRDPSLKKIERQGRLIRLTEPTTGIRNAFVLFDDVRKPELLDWRDQLYQQGRHNKVTVITINHSIREGQKIKNVIQDSEWIVLFPQSNKTIISTYLTDVLRLRTRFKNELINLAEDDGRYLFIHTWAPSFFMTSKSVVPF